MTRAAAVIVPELRKWADTWDNRDEWSDTWDKDAEYNMSHQVLSSSLGDDRERSQPWAGRVVFIFRRIDPGKNLEYIYERLNKVQQSERAGQIWSAAWIGS